MPFVTSEERTSTLTQHGPPAFTATQFSPTRDQNTHIQFQSLVEIAGNSVDLRCSSSVATTFRWNYRPLGSRSWMPIFVGDLINPVFFHKRARMSVSNCGDGQCTFNIDDLQLDDAGTFTCKRAMADKYWSLTILGK